MQSLVIWGLIGTGGQNVVESAIFEIADPDLPIHNATFMGLLPKPKLYTKFKVATFNGCRNK